MEQIPLALCVGIPIAALMHLMSMVPRAAWLLALAHLPRGQTLVINNVAIIDVTTGRVQEPQNIIIEGNKIARIERAGASSKQAANSIDGSAKFAMPGLCDMHVHAYFTNDARQFAVTDNATFPLLVANGVTCIRDLGSNLGAIMAGRTRIAAHQLDGPRVFTTGPMLDGPDSPFETALKLETRDQARQAVKMLKKAGVDFIKVHLLPSAQVFAEIAETSQDEGILFGGHVPDSVTAQQAVDAGMGFIEHMSRIEATDKNFNKLVETLVEKEVWQCPTLKLSPAGQRLKLAKTLREADVRMVAGTDSPAGKGLCPGVSLLDELGLMNRAGLTRLQSIQAATVNAAEAMGKLSEMGTLEAGKLADLVLLEKNPLDDIENIRSISAVVADGQLYSRDKLDKMLLSAKKLVQCDKRATVAPRNTCCSL